MKSKVRKIDMIFWGIVVVFLILTYIFNKLLFCIGCIGVVYGIRSIAFMNLNNYKEKTAKEKSEKCVVDEKSKSYFD